MISSNEFKRLLNIVDPEERAKEYASLDSNIINLAVAENVLIYKFLRQHVFEKLPVIQEYNIRYTIAQGNEEFRANMAELLKHVLGVNELDKNHIFGTTGVSAALECLAFALFHPNDSNKVLTPQPCWQGFKWCFQQRPPNGLIVTFPSKQITLKQVQRIWSQHQDAKILLLTNPTNPLGINYIQENLNQIYDFVLRHTPMHIISDEIYASSQVKGAKPAFVSALNLEAYKSARPEWKERIHVVWGFSKDFGLSGFKAGVIVSTSNKVKKYQTDSKDRQWKGVSWFTPIDSLKHLVLLQLLKNNMPDTKTPLWKQALIEYQQALTESWRNTKALLEKYKIKYLKDSNAAQFLWLDLREYTCSLEQSQQHYHETLYPEISILEQHLDECLRKSGVMLLPGSILSNPEPGWFRLCYTAQTQDKVKEAVCRIAVALGLKE